MLNINTIERQIRHLVLSTIKDGEQGLKHDVIGAISHNLNDRRYACTCLAGCGNGSIGDTELIVKVGHLKISIACAGKVRCTYYEKQEDYCHSPKFKEHTDVVVRVIGYAK